MRWNMSKQALGYIFTALFAVGICLTVSGSLFIGAAQEIDWEVNVQAQVQPNFANSRYKEIYLAGGCFWGTQAYFDRMIGVIYTNVGYANGVTEETDYYSLARTGHAETVYVVYDPEKLPLETLLTYYYGIIDPTLVDQQAYDVGPQYRTGIYFVDEDDLEVIKKVTEEEQKKYRQPIVTQIEPLKNYVLAEEYHQDYLVKNPGDIATLTLPRFLRRSPGLRQGTIKAFPGGAEAALTAEQFAITQDCETEYPFANEYWDNEELGIYVDIVTGEPLFLSTDQFHPGRLAQLPGPSSGCGHL